MTARQIQACLIRSRLHRNFVLPNYTPKGWFECDLFEVTPAKFLREYEIKISRADFKADTQKRNVTERVLEREYPFRARYSVYPPETKHGLLVAKSARGPSRFWYVTPKGLLAADEVPIWAGLIEVELSSYSGMLHERETVKAPLLHREKLDDAIYQHARGICYWRFHNTLTELAKLQRSYKALRDSKPTTTPDTE